MEEESKLEIPLKPKISISHDFKSYDNLDDFITKEIEQDQGEEHVDMT